MFYGFCVSLVRYFAAGVKFGILSPFNSFWAESQQQNSVMESGGLRSIFD